MVSRTAFLALTTLALCCCVVTPARATDVDGGNDCTRPNVDFGDAPENVLAYPGIMGNFPTCIAAGGVGTQTVACMPISTLPGPVGFVKHVSSPNLYWLGCPATMTPQGIDSETDGKVNNIAMLGAPSVCGGIPTDCIEAAFGLSFGQDECFGGTDAGVSAPTLMTCTSSTISFTTRSCSGGSFVAYLNVLIDMNRDGDWNDNTQCLGGCAYEWAVKNAKITIFPGCGTQTSPAFIVGSIAGPSWMRVTISDGPVTDDFPWNGSAGIAGQALSGGETEDYPVTILAGPNPCDAQYRDFGDAPETLAAYSGGVTGHFPTCLLDTPAGSQTSACLPALSTAPGLTGYVEHVAVAGDPLHFWLGCPAGAATAVDDEANGKVSGAAAPGGPSLCDAMVTTDCVETAFGGTTFAQDECYGDADAAIAAAVSFSSCQFASVPYRATSCTNIQVYLNILVDMNQDGDWNDNFQCTASCAYEWAVKNVVVSLATGCNTLTSPTFLVGPVPGGATRNGWMRITLTQDPVTDEFPWNGSKGMMGGTFRNGETEDYPVTIAGPTNGDPCVQAFDDWGDAPEFILAYPGGMGAPGNFPTCTGGGMPGTQTIACMPVSSAPGVTGFVHHQILAGDAQSHIWLGCPSPAAGTFGIDSETNGKENTSALPGTPSTCSMVVTTDCVQSAFGGANFGQDECYGDTDAGVSSAITLFTCQNGSVNYKAYNCNLMQDVQAYLNICVDMNQDGDWNDNFLCVSGCAYEWAVRNVPITLVPGCNSMASPSFLVGPNAGHGWLRVTISRDPAPVDYPWNGSVSLPAQQFLGGETEDYPIEIQTPQGPCPIAYTDFGDAPEDLQAYADGTVGRYPTCLTPTAAGTRDLYCAPPVSSIPGPTGYVEHVALASDAIHYWLGCGIMGSGGVDSEANGKVNLATIAGGPSFCDPNTVFTDCLESTADGLSFGQDECAGDGMDAGLGSTVMVDQCQQNTLTFSARNCSASDIDCYVNVLFDWNQDGDWNDNVPCTGACVNEWVFKNETITLLAGCNTITLPPFQGGPKRGPSWMRISLTRVAVRDDYPWNGSLGEPNGYYEGGETEDYPVLVRPTTTGLGDELLPRDIRLAVQPNPSHSSVYVGLALPREQRVSMGVYDVTGRRLATLVDGILPAGERTVRWSFRDDAGRPLPAGMYLVRADVGGQVFTKTFVRIQ